MHISYRSKSEQSLELMRLLSFQTVSTVICGVVDLDASSAGVCRTAPIFPGDPSYRRINDRF